MAILAFDVYGTIVDPLAVAAAAESMIGDQATSFAQYWRNKLVEYSFRRALMRNYEDFSVCTRQSLDFIDLELCLCLTKEQKEALLQAQRHAPIFPEVPAGLHNFHEAGHALYAFSNGPVASVEEALNRTGIRSLFREIVSADDLRTYKPDPGVYAYLSRRVQAANSAIWVISSNAWDVIGAKSAGLRAAWLRRNPRQAFDPWGIEPDLISPDLTALAEALSRLLAAEL